MKRFHGDSGKFPYVLAKPTDNMREFLNVKEKPVYIVKKLSCGVE